MICLSLHRVSLLASALIGLSLLAAPAGAQASPELAVQMGCSNCHGAHRRGDAPDFKHLSEKLAKRKGEPAAVEKFVEHWRAGEFMEHISVHERTSPETAKVLIQWLVEGAN